MVSGQLLGTSAAPASTSSQLGSSFPLIPHGQKSIKVTLCDVQVTKSDLSEIPISAGKNHRNLVSKFQLSHFFLDARNPNLCRFWRGVHGPFRGLTMALR